MSRVMDAHWCTSMRPTAAVRSSTSRTCSVLLMTGLVLAMRLTAVYPPRTAARLPLAKSSFCVCPGSLKWACRSQKAGRHVSLPASTTTAPSEESPLPTAVMTPLWTRMSVASSRTESPTCAPRIRSDLVSGAIVLPSHVRAGRVHDEGDRVVGLVQAQLIEHTDAQACVDVVNDDAVLDARNGQHLSSLLGVTKSGPCARTCRISSA